MKRFFRSLLVLFIILIGLYFVGKYYFPQYLNLATNVVTDIADKAINKVEEKIEEYKPAEEPGQLLAGINTNLDSDLAMVIKAPNGEGISVFTKDVNGVETVDKVVFVTEENKAGLIELDDEYGLPTNVEFEGLKVSFSNYTEDMTVDVTITKPDGTEEVLEKQSFDPNNKTFSLIEPVFANYYQYKWLAEQGDKKAEARNRREYIQIMNNLARVGDYTDELAEYLKAAPGTALNVLGCGAGIITTVLSAGSASPLAYLGCASLAVRITTTNTNLGPCHGDILACGSDGVKNFVQEAYKRSGVIGFLRSSEDQSLLEDYQIKIEKINGILVEEYTVGNDAYHFLGHLDSGSYFITLSKSGFQDKKIKMIKNNDRVNITDTDGNKKLFDERVKEGIVLHYMIWLDPDIPFDGEWVGRATSSISVIDDETVCEGANLTFEIEDGKITGQADADLGYKLNIQGTVDVYGSIVGGMAMGPVNAADFNGKLVEDEEGNGTGTGTWKDQYGCYGTFKLEKK